MRASCTLAIDPKWSGANKATKWQIETVCHKTRILRRVYYRAEARGYNAKTLQCVAHLGAPGGWTQVVAPTSDEAVELMRDYICRQRKAHEDWQRSRDIREFAGSEVCP